MRPRRGVFNPKRRLRSLAGTESEQEFLDHLASRVGYGGNPEHKRDPGDFGLKPPSDPRPGKTLCDVVGIRTRWEALSLLREGLRRGLVSAGQRGEWPRNVWAVSSDGVPLEAQLENAERGVYHGYPMPVRDPFRQEVLKCWGAS
ncbi:MAG: hypothetical protein HQL59_09750 [Magnetococcales bacterium]|nr:hypothetical protein [Magnetococcales bacterium]